MKLNLYKEYAHNLLASIYFTQSKYETATTEYKTLIELENKLNSVPYLNVIANNSLGLINTANNDHTKAIQYFQKAISLFNNNDFESADFKNEIIGNLGKSYYLNGNYKKADICFNESLKSASKNNQILTLARIYRNIGDAHFNKKNYSSSNKW